MTSLGLKWDRRHERISAEPQTRGHDTSSVFTCFGRLKTPPTPKKGGGGDRGKQISLFFPGF